jgi:hypothetical protein
MEVIDTDQQKKYRSGVGILLYSTNYSRSDIRKVVKVLSIGMDGATCGAYHETLRAIKFVIDTKDLGLKIEPKIENEMNWNLEFSVTFIGQETQKQELVSLDLLYTYLTYQFVGVPKLKRINTLSSTEAEYIAISEAAKGIKE